MSEGGGEAEREICDGVIFSWLKTDKAHSSSACVWLSTIAAKEEGKDVVLIDTAGRMQDNQTLMTALVNVRTAPCSSLSPLSSLSPSLVF